MPFDTLVLEDRGAVRVITVHRPEKLNALNRQVLSELQQAFDAAREDAGVRAVVLRGAGPKAFVAGADIAEMADLTPVEGRAFSLAGQRVMRTIETLGKPVVAMVHGFALGGGLELAMACHLRIAGEGAKFGLPEVTLGLLPGFGGTQRLLRLAGRAATLDLALTGAMIDAQRALQIGLVTRVHAAEALEDATFALAGQLAALAPLALRGVLDAVVIGGEAPLETGLEFESNAFGMAFSTDDMREGTRAFLERRKPAFQGR